jgi:hypothetical protein
MTRPRSRPAFAAALAAALAAAPAPGEAGSEAGRIGVELNKLESYDGGCRSFFLFRNGAGVDFTAFEMALALLDGGGVIDRLLTVDAAPLPAGRTTLKIFEIEGLDCAALGEALLHDMPRCEAADGAARDCFALIDLGSRAAAPLTR